MRTTTAILLTIAGLAGTAFAQAPVRPAKVGDVHVYSGELRAERLRYEETVTVTAVEGDRLRTRHLRSDRPAPTEGLYGTDWSTYVSGSSGPQLEPPSKALQQPLQPGSSWEGVHQTTGSSGAKSRLKLESTVAARETLKTPAGEFDTFRIDTKGYLSGLSWQGGVGIAQRIWYAPAIDRIVRMEFRELRSMGADNVIELKAFRPAD